ncbi:MAG: leucine-rich repeat domain-containing protein, partial [Acutalibacteraceae bacterium]
GTSYIIPSFVEKIGDSAFIGCENLTSITIPNSVKNIGSEVFWYCTGLTDITIPGSVKSIGFQVFLSCTSLKSIEISEGVTSIGSGAFYNCKSLTSVKIPNSVTSINQNAFQGCINPTILCHAGSYAEKYAIDNKIDYKHIATSIEQFEYTLNDSQKTATITKYIGTDEYVVIPSDINGYTVTSIDDPAFENCQILTGIEIPNSVKYIGMFAFSGCTNLTRVEIPDSVTDLDALTFMDCISLKAINVDANNKYLTSVDGVLFSKDMTALLYYPSAKEDAEYSIPDGVTDIGELAFVTNKLKIVNIPDSAINFTSYAFNFSESLTSINVSEGNRYYKSEDGVLFKDNTLICYPSQKEDEEYTIPSNVTKLGYCAFRCCGNLRSIVIPSNVRDIGVGVFDYCPNLTIFCKAGSCAETYAKNNNISYQYIV